MTGNTSGCPSLVTLVMMLNILLWNIRGAASKGITAMIRDMKRQYKLDIVVILETRISDN